ATKTGNYQNSVPPLIVQFSKTDQNHIGLLEDDLSVMSVLMDRALERALGEDSPDYKMGIPMTLSSGSRSVRAMYIEGLGALFMVKVNFPVMPPPAMEEKKIEPAQNSDWDKARNEIYGQDEQSWTGDMPPSSGGEYNSAQVEGLKKELLQSLKNASNIQDLKPEEFITITVFGSPGLV